MAKMETQSPLGSLSSSELDINPRSPEIKRIKFKAVCQALIPSLLRGCSGGPVMVTAGLRMKSRVWGGHSCTKNPTLMPKYPGANLPFPQRKDNPLGLAHVEQEERGLLQKQGEKTNPQHFQQHGINPAQGPAFPPV